MKGEIFQIISEIRFYEPDTMRVLVQIKISLEIKLFEYARFMIFDGFRAYIQNSGDLSHPFSGHQQSENLLLTFTQQRKGWLLESILTTGVVLQKIDDIR